MITDRADYEWARALVSEGLEGAGVRRRLPADGSVQMIDVTSGWAVLNHHWGSPERLGEYRIVHPLGEGAMGKVYVAEQESLGRRVAIKVLPRQALLDVKHLKRFRREARIAAGLHHTNIVSVFGVGQHEGKHFYVMQYIQGPSLDRKLTGEEKSYT